MNRTATRRNKAFEKARDLAVERAYYATCSGIQIDIMDISKVFAEGRRLLDEGADEAALKAGIFAFVQTIARN